MLEYYLRISAFLTLLLIASSASAHDFWVEPNEFMPASASEVQISLREGVAFKGNTLPYITDWFRDFSQVSNSGRLPVESMLGNDPAATLVIKPGPLLLGYQSVRSFVELDAAKFNQYLEHEGIEFIRAERQARGEDDQPAPEYFVRCAKTLLQSGPATSGDVYKTVLGYTLELVPESNPYELEAGDELGFQLWYRNEPAEGLLIQAFTRDDPDSIQKVRTDADGHGVITVDRAGVWLIKAVNIQPIVADPKALWQSYWATYLFELPAA
jgi:uncharacterized GH25 family protein